VNRCTRTWAAKVKHIRGNRHVAVTVDVMEAPLKNKAVLLDGTAEIVTTGVQEMTTAIYQKYMGADAAKSPKRSKASPHHACSSRSRRRLSTRWTRRSTSPPAQ